MSIASARELLRHDGGFAEGFWAGSDLSESEFTEKYHDEVARRLSCPSDDEVKQVCMEMHRLILASIQ